MKKLICAGVALSSLFCVEQNWGMSRTILDTLKAYENYGNKTKMENLDRVDTITRYNNEMKTFNGTRIEVSEDGKTLNIWKKENGQWNKQGSFNGGDGWLNIQPDSDTNLCWYKNSLILWNVNAKDNYSVLADRVYTFRDLNCNKLNIGAREGFMNFANINASHMKVFTHAGQDCGNITVSKNPTQGNGYNKDLVEGFFANYGSDEVLNTAFYDGWKSTGSLKSKSVEFDGLDANIHGSLNAQSVTMRGGRLASDGKTELKPGLLIGNPWISESFTNTWLDYLRSKKAFEKAVVGIQNLNMQNGATVTIPNATYDDEKNCVNWEGSWRKIIIEKISGAEVETCVNPDKEVTLVDFLRNKIKNGTSTDKRSKGFHLKLTDKSTFDRDEGDVVVICKAGKSEISEETLHYKKVKTSNNENYQFFDKDSSCRFSPDEEEKLKYHLVDHPLRDDDSGNGGNGGGDDDDDDDNSGGGNGGNDIKTDPKPEKKEVKKKKQNQQQKRPSKQQKTFASLEEFVKDANRNNRQPKQFSCNFTISDALKEVVKGDTGQAAGSISCDAGIFPGLSGQRVKFERNEEGELVFSDESGNKFGEKVQIFLTNLCRELKRNDQGFGANDDSEGAPKPEKRDITKKHEVKADLTDPTVKQMNDWAVEKLKQKSGHKMAAEMQGAQRLKNMSVGKDEIVDVVFHDDNNNLPTVQLKVSVIGSGETEKFVFFTTNNKKLSDSAQKLLNKMADHQKKFDDEQLASEWEANKVQLQAIKIDAGINKNDKDDDE